ncbi:YdeI/OmpD-associated family protein [Gordonia sp. MP11Mi]|uniref:OmdA domain containing protein n=1 Tax=Gordonia sp. MP11Mi TaxID=3022769 RepID=A0AA97CXX4_9ACTN
MNEQTNPANPLVLADVEHWRKWLDGNENSSDGVWLMLAKKGVTSPTSITYQSALEEALCSGWIDGQRRGLDERTFIQRFTPRRARSAWSQRNVAIVERLATEQRLRRRSVAEIDRAKADGRWHRAYPGQSSAKPPAALTAAFDAAPEARSAFSALSRAEQYSVLHPLLTAPNDDALDKRIQRVIERLIER